MAVNVYYGQSTTAAGETQKVVVLYGETVIPEFSEGDLVTVYFKEGNTATNPTLTFERNDTQAQTTSNSAGHPIKIRGAEPQGNSNEFIAIDAWEAGETKQFVYTPYIYNPDRAGADTGAYWEMLDGGNATTLLYGDTKLLNESNAAGWLAGDPLADEDKMSITPAMIRALLKPNEEEEETLKWEQVQSSGTAYLSIGDMSISTFPEDKKNIQIPIAELKEALGIPSDYVYNTYTYTSDFINDGESHTDSYVFIENVEEDPVQFLDSFTVGDISDEDHPIRPTSTFHGPVNIDGITTINNSLNAGATTVSSLVSNGGVTAASDIESTGGHVISNLDIKEGSNYLKDKYSGVLMVKRWRTGNFTLGGKEHNHKVSTPNSTIAVDGYTPVGIVSWNINQVSNTDTTHLIYPWEMYLTNNTVYMGFMNTSSKTVNFYVNVDILYVKNTGYSITRPLV